MTPGETILTGAPLRCDCRKENPVLPVEVLHTPAGYYIGTHCEHCGPYSRESGYFITRPAAQAVIPAYEEAWAKRIAIGGLGTPLVEPDYSKFNGLTDGLPNARTAGFIGSETW